MNNGHDAGLMLEAAQALACARSGLRWPETGIDLIVRLKERADVLGATKEATASPTHQEAATSRDQEPVRVVVRPGFGGEPAVARIESELKAAGIPARVGPTGIEVKFGKVEWQAECDGDVVVRWWPAGR